MIRIIPYKTIYQSSIDQMMIKISAEFETPIFNQKPFVTIKKLDKCWIAIKNHKSVIGTIGLFLLKHQNVVLKSLFVSKNYRGSELGVSNNFIYEITKWCIKNNINTIYLGTMRQFERAQKFYIKHGFKRVEKDQLPSDFIQNPIDDFYYKLNL